MCAYADSAYAMSSWWAGKTAGHSGRMTPLPLTNSSSPYVCSRSGSAPPRSAPASPDSSRFISFMAGASRMARGSRTSPPRSSPSCVRTRPGTAAPRAGTSNCGSRSPRPHSASRCRTPGREATPGPRRGRRPADPLRDPAGTSPGRHPRRPLERAGPRARREDRPRRTGPAALTGRPASTAHIPRPRMTRLPGRQAAPHISALPSIGCSARAAACSGGGALDGGRACQIGPIGRHIRRI